MSPSKKSPKLVSPKAKKGKKGAASVFPKDKGGKTWSEIPDGVLPDSERKKRRPAKPTITPAAKKGLKRLSKAAFGSAAPKPAAKRARKTAATPKPKKKKAPAPSKPEPPRSSWRFDPDGLQPARPVPVVVSGNRLACPCCVKQNGRPFHIVPPLKKKKLMPGSRCPPMQSRDYYIGPWNRHLTERHEFPSLTSRGPIGLQVYKPGSGRGGNTGDFQ